jgi:hypothetical protein
MRGATGCFGTVWEDMMGWELGGLWCTDRHLKPRLEAGCTLFGIRRPAVQTPWDAITAKTYPGCSESENHAVGSGFGRDQLGQRQFGRSVGFAAAQEIQKVTARWPEYRPQRRPAARWRRRAGA